jgi:hypothetical protein
VQITVQRADILKPPVNLTAFAGRLFTGRPGDTNFVCPFSPIFTLKQIPLCARVRPAKRGYQLLFSNFLPQNRTSFHKNGVQLHIRLTIADTSVYLT